MSARGERKWDPRDRGVMTDVGIVGIETDGDPRGEGSPSDERCIRTAVSARGWHRYIHTRDESEAELVVLVSSASQRS
jgi:hypothetical protein